MYNIHAKHSYPLQRGTCHRSRVFTAIKGLKFKTTQETFILYSTLLCIKMLLFSDYHCRK